MGVLILYAHLLILTKFLFYGIMDLIKGIKELIYIDNIVPINKETGEIIEDGYVIFTTKQLEKHRKEKEDEKFKNAKIKEDYKEYGNFIWIIYNTGKLLFDGKIKNETLTKLIYLSTFIKYSDSKKNNIIKNGKIKWIELTTNNKKPITRNNLGDILNISDRSVLYFIKETVENEIIYIGDDILYINSKYIAKGNIINIKYNPDDTISRIYIDTVRCLYKGTLIKDHKLLSYFFLMIPYLNLEWNVLCYNQEEKDIKKIKQMSLNEFCSIIGYNKTHIYSLIKKLLKIKIGDKSAISITLFGDEAYVFINPKVFYAGNHHKEIIDMAKFKCPEKTK